MQQLELELPAAKYTIWDNDVPIIRQGRTHHVYLTDFIQNPFTYNELAHTLREAYPSDEFIIYLNTPGGNIDSALMIIDAIKNTSAKVKAHLSGTVASAGTLITMVCHEIYIAPHTHFMIHNYSVQGVGGKGAEVRDYVKFNDTELNKTFKAIYGNFLTDKEASEIIEGKDLWLSSEEVIERWNKKCQS